MKRLLPTLLVLSLTGCAAINPNTQPVTKLDPHTLGLQADQSVNWPTNQWWQHYQDAQLNALVDKALADSPSMSAAESRLALANAAVSTARAPLLPSVDGNGQLTRERISNNYIYPAPLAGSVQTDNDLELNFSYELDFWGKNRALYKAARADQQAAQAQYQAARLMLANAVVQSYFNLQNAFAQEQVLHHIVQQRQDLLSLTQGRFHSGLDTAVSVKQAQSTLAAAQVAATENETTIASLRNQLSALTVQGPAAGHNIVAVAEHTPLPAPPTDIPLDLLGHRPDIVAARWSAAAADQQVTAAKAEFYPNVNLAAFVGLQSLGTEYLFNHDSGIAGVTPAISLPIFHGGALNANLAQQRAGVNLAISNYNDAVLTAVRQVADALDSIRLLARQRVEQREARDAIDAAYDLAVKRYRAGLGNYLDVLTAQSDVLTQDQQDTALNIRAYQLDADLAYALGGGYSSPAEPSASTH